MKVVLNEFVAGSYTSLANVSRTIPLLPMLLPRSSHRASSIKVSCLVALQLQRPRLGSRAIPACLPSNLTLFGVDIYFIFGIPGTLWCEYYVYYESLCLLYIEKDRDRKIRKKILFMYFKKRRNSCGLYFNFEKIFRLFFREKYIQYRKIICNFAINGKKIEFKINNSEWRMIERVGSNYFLRISIIDIILFPNTRLFHYQNIHLYCDVHINRDINSQDSSCVRVEILIIREIFA